MAREALLAQLLRTIVEKEGPPPTNDNALIQKMVAPNDSCKMSDTPTFSVLNLADFVWGGLQDTAIMGVYQQYKNPVWKWGQGQWK